MRGKVHYILSDLLDLFRFYTVRPHRGLPRHKLKGFQVYPEGRNLNAKFLESLDGKDLKFISRDLPIASMGSCFATNIKKYLVDKGYNYLQTEQNQWSEHASCAWGRVFTLACAKQVFDYSFSSFTPRERFWSHEGRVIDPYRDRVAYPSLKQAREDLARHCAASARALRQCKLFILTLGQNEGWHNQADGTTYVAKPPLEILQQRKEIVFKRFSLEENISYLEAILGHLKAHNKDCRIILSVSPVPSAATFCDENVVVRSFENKCLLRAAITAICRKPGSEAIYFPSFEMVYSLFRLPFYYDNAHVKVRVMNCIMQTFERTFALES